MKYDTQKAFPYPVLSDDKKYSDDYLNWDFQVDISLKRDAKPGCVVLTAKFTIKEEAILSHIISKSARYAVHVLCAQTNYRRLICSPKDKLTHTFSGGALYDEVVLMGGIVTTKSIKNYHSKNFHSEIKDETYNMSEGSVLAIAKPHIYYVDVNLNRPLGSVFELAPREDIESGKFEYSISGDMVKIFMPEDDLKKINRLRGDRNARYFVMMSIYYPVLVEVLRAIAANPEEHDGKKWYRAITHQINRLEIDLGDGSECYLHAQQLMKFPLSKLPSMEDFNE